MDISITQELETGKVFAVSEFPRMRDLIKSSADVIGSLWIGGYYVVHERNNNRIYTYLAEEHVEGIRQTRSVVQTLLGRDDVGWTYTQMARKCVEWLGITQQPVKKVKELLPVWHYQRCIPCYPEQAVMYDLEGAYWQFASMLKSPVLSYVSGILTPLWVSDRKLERWELLRSAIKSNKRLRLAVVGVNSVGWSNKPQGNIRSVYRAHGGRLIGKGSPVGKLQPLSIVAVRSTYEVTQLQTLESNSVYSNGDCVVCEHNGRPNAWEDMGLRFTVKAHWKEGKRDRIRNIVGYSIGDTATKGFGAAPNMKTRPFEQPLISGPMVHRQLLAGRSLA